MNVCRIKNNQFVTSKVSNKKDNTSFCAYIPQSGTVNTMFTIGGFGLPHNIKTCLNTLENNNRFGKQIIEFLKENKSKLVEKYNHIYFSSSDIFDMSRQKTHEEALSKLEEIAKDAKLVTEEEVDKILEVSPEEDQKITDLENQLQTLKNEIMKRQAKGFEKLGMY